jgi:Predicted glycosyltransferases
MLPTCSIIICTKDRPRDLELTLSSLRSQTHPPDSLIVIDDSKDEKTCTLLQTHSFSKKIYTQYLHSLSAHSGLPAARNVGIQALPEGTDIVIFIDDDVILEKDYIQNLCEEFSKNPDLYGATGYITNGNSNRSFVVKVILTFMGLVNPVLIPSTLYNPTVTKTAEAMMPLFQKNGKTSVSAQWLSGCNMAYRVSVFSEGFRFDEKLIRYALGEDMIFSHMLHLQGKELALVYSAKIQHRCSSVGRLSSRKALVMKLGYRRYAQILFNGRSFLGSGYFGLFLIEVFIASFILSLKYRMDLSYFRETILAFKEVRPLIRELESGSLESLNNLL